ncbi:MAG: DUF484 family protein [Alphaproteobacteria bacterium]
MATRDDAATFDAEDDLSPGQVADYLRRHPEFLGDNIDLIPSPPSRWGAGPVVDLQQYMVDRLRDELDNLRGCADELLQTTRTNMSTQGRTHRAVLAVLGAGGFEGLCRVVSEDVASLLDVDIAVLGLEPGATAGDGVPLARLEAGQVTRLLGRREALLRDHVVGDARLFGEGAASVQSDALVRLSPGGGLPDGLLALGSRDPSFFHPGQGTELLMFLARVVEQGVRQWVRASG